MNMKKYLIALMLTVILMLITGCSSSSYQSIMDEITTEHDNPADAYNALKDITVPDEAEAVQLQATKLWFALKSPPASVRDESQKLLQMLHKSNIDVSAADGMLQTMIYLSAVANKNILYNHKLNFNIKQVIDQLCVPTNKIFQRIEDIHDMSQVHYDYHLANACQEILNDQSAAKDLSLALLFKKERGCTFTTDTNTRLFFSELIECRLKAQGVYITHSLPSKEEL